MEQHQRTILYRLQIVTGLLFLLWAGLSTVQAQSGCTGDPCVFFTPTATPTFTPVIVPTSDGTTTPVPTPVPMPSAVPFPNPNYAVPTSIPAMSFPTVPSALDVDLPGPGSAINPTPFATPASLALTPLAAPSAIAIGTVSIATPEAVELDEINTDLDITYSAFNTPSAAGSGGVVTNTFNYSITTTTIDGAQAIISDVVSYTNTISDQIAAVEYTSTLTVTAAPDWYAPALPREIAGIGWTFELLSTNIDSPQHYSLNTYSNLFGYMVAMPFKLVKSIWQLFRFLGPFGLFIVWLIVFMLPAVTGFKVLLFLKNVMIRIINFLIDLIWKILQFIDWLLDWLFKLIEAIPFIE